MSTTLKFEAPADLSVGRVRVQSQGETLAEWIATPSEKTRVFVDVAPGVYTAFIEPLGQPSRPYMFEVHAGVSNNVVTPALSVLAAQGLGKRFLTMTAPATTVLEQILTGSAEVASPVAEAAPGAAIAKALAIGLSQDEKADSTGGWRPYSGASEPKVELTGGELHILLDRTSAPLSGPVGQRLRLSASIEATRVERFMVPLFAGGTRIVFSASRLTTADLTFRVIPMNLERRALTQALQSGVLAEAQAVRDDVLRNGTIGRFVEANADEDPWAAVTAALLTIRFPELFGPKDIGWAPDLVARYPWLPDVHVLASRQALTAAGTGPEARLTAAIEALNYIKKARELGAPYFAYTNQLIGEILGALGGAKLEGLSDRVEGEMLSWRRDVPLQRSAGAIFSWVMSEKSSEAPRHSVAYTASRGSLDERYSRILFRGQIDLTQIGLTAPSMPVKRDLRGKKINTASPKAKAAAKKRREARSSEPDFSRSFERDPPGLRRAITVSDDPHKGRFGDLAERNGYRLDVTFETGGPSWVGVVLKVVADPRTHEPNYSDMVEFFLHPTFDPPRLSAVFQGYEAKLKAYAVGGFTAGAWLRAQQIELELDLALLPGAPKIIQEL